jgi:predicted phage-related endonuclease
MDEQHEALPECLDKFGNIQSHLKKQDEKLDTIEGHLTNHLPTMLGEIKDDIQALHKHVITAYENTLDNRSIIDKLVNAWKRMKLPWRD